MSINSSFQYLLVLPNGDVKGFEDIDMAKAYINMYYDKKIRNSNDRVELNDLTDTNDEFVNTICQNLGVVEGECKVYDTVKIIERIQSDMIFDEEKEEVISKLMSPHIKFNVFDYAIDNIFNEVESVDMFETYGEHINR